MRYEPREHHQLISDALFMHDRHAVFAGCGLGKTASTAHGLHRRYVDGATQRTLIVAPLRVAILTWPDEFAKWDDFWIRHANLRTEEGRAAFASGEADIGIINHEMLVKTLHWINKNQCWPDTLIMDESTRLKNPSGKWHRSILQATGWFLKTDQSRYDYRFRNRYALTGTPMPNGLMDLFGQYRLLDGGKRLGRAAQAFEDAWMDVGYNGYTLTPKEGAEDKVRARVKDITLTLKSSDWLDIPDTHYLDEQVALPKKAIRDYNELRNELLVVLKTGQIEAPSAGALMSKLLQITSGAVYDKGELLPSVCPGKFKKVKGVHQVHDAKIKKLKSVLERTGNTLVLCSFKHELDRICGAVKGAVRFDTDRVSQWNDGKIKALVAHPASMSHGLNMQDGGSDVVWFSLPMDREVYDQANARLARTGQKEKTYVRHIVCPGTVDDAVAEMLRRKGDAQSGLMDALSNFKKLSLG